MKRVCSIVGCNKEHEAKGFCKNHYRKFKVYGDPTYNTQLENTQYNVDNIRVRYSRDGSCAIEGCNKPIKARRLCSKHYNEAVRTKKLETHKSEYIGHYSDEEIINTLKEANVALKGNMTISEYREWSKANNSISSETIRIRFGSWSEALSKAGINEVISERWSRDGICSVEGCNNPIKAKKLCNNHYMRTYKANRKKEIRSLF